MNGIQYYRWAIVLPAIVLLLIAIPTANSLAESVFTGILEVLFGAEQAAESVFESAFLLALISPAVVAYLLMGPVVLWRTWSLPEAAYRKRFALFPLALAATAFLLTVVLMLGPAGWSAIGMGLLVAVPALIVGYAYVVVAVVVRAGLRAGSLMEQPSQAAAPTNRLVICAAAMAFACGLALLVGAASLMSRGAAGREASTAGEEAVQTRWEGVSAGAVGTESATAAAEAFQEEAASIPLQRRWSVEPGGWNKAVVFHPNGNVLAFDSRRLYVLARDTGQVLGEFETCMLIKGGAVLLSDGNLALICRDGVERLELSGGARERVVDLAEEPAAGHAMGRLLVVASGTRALLYDARSWKLVATFVLPSPLTGVALSPDARYLATSSGAGLSLFDVDEGTDRKLLGKACSAVAISDDGGTIFVACTGFDAFMIDAATGARRTSMKTGSWIEGAEFMGPGLLAATGSDGLVVYGSGGVRVFDTREAGPATAVAAEDGRVCAGTRNGAVTCYSIAPLEPSNYAPSIAASRAAPRSAQPPRAVPEAPSDAVKPTRRQLGTLVSVSGAELTVRSSQAGPPIGTTGELAKQVAMPVGDVKLWVVIARVKVTGAERDRMTLEVIEERTVLTVNDQKRDQFTPGSRTRLEW